MSWEYRVVRENGFFTIFRVYNSPFTWTPNPYPGGDDPEDLRDDLKMMLSGCDKPVLEERYGKLVEVDSQ